MLQAEETIRERLLALQDETYRDFQAKLLPTVEKSTIIGVRTPVLRALAKELSGTEEAAQFLAALPHDSYDENNLHCFLIERMKDYGAIITALNEFLPHVDNWATCDLISPKVFRKHLPELLGEIRRWMASDATYTIRFGMEMLMTFYLDDAFAPEYLSWAAQIRSGEYYVNMMTAWFFATALAKQYDAALPYIEGQKLDKWTHNKAIQKAIESYRITDKQKTHLRSLKQK